MTTTDGIALATVIILLLVAVPISIFTYKIVDQALKQSVFQKKKQTAVQDAISGIQDWMRMFTDDPMASSRLTADDLTRSVYEMGEKRRIEFSFEDKREEDRTILVSAVGKYGYDPDHPDAHQRVSALIRFESPLTTFSNDYRGGNGLKQFKPETDNATYEGVFVIDHLVVDKRGTRFRGGPVYVIRNANVGGVANSSRPFVEGDLYVGGNNQFQSGDVSGTMYDFVPPVPQFKIDLSVYRSLATWTTNEPTAIRFNGDGTFQEVANDDLDNYVTILPSNVPSLVRLQEARSIPATGGIFLAENTNIGVWGTINPRVTVVATGGSNTRGNIVVCDNIWYVKDDGVSISSSATNISSLALLAGNSIWFKKFTEGDFSVRGVFYQEKYVAMRSGDNASTANFFLYGTRNAPLAITGHEYKDGTFKQFYDGELRKFPPPGLPEQPMMVSFNIN